jgi:hypothetical protein
METSDISLLFLEATDLAREVRKGAECYSALSALVTCEDQGPVFGGMGGGCSMTMVTLSSGPKYSPVGPLRRKLAVYVPGEKGATMVTPMLVVLSGAVSGRAW